MDLAVVVLLAVLFLYGPVLIAIFWANAQRRNLLAKIEDLRADLELQKKRFTQLQVKVSHLSPQQTPTPEPGRTEPVMPAPPAPEAPTSVPFVAENTPQPEPQPESVVRSSSIPPTPPPLPQIPADSAAEMNFEEQLGTRGFVWIGAIALSLAGIFLVKYSFDRGWISPAVRIAFGILFGAVFIAAAEWMKTKSERIGQGLAAAGVAVLYASFLAAHHLYHLISPLLAFALLSITTAGACVLAFRHGPFVALLGMIGGFLTPVWIHTGVEAALPLFAYLALLETGLIFVTFKKQWWILSFLTLFAVFAWALVWVFANYTPADAIVVNSFVIGSAALFTYSRFRSASAPALLSSGAIAAAILVTSSAIGKAQFQGPEWIFLIALAVGTLALSRHEEHYFPINWFGVIISVLVFYIWSTAPAKPLPYLLRIAVISLIYAAIPFFFLWKEKKPLKWAILAVASTFAYFGVAYQLKFHTTVQISWTLVTLILTAAYAAAAVSILRARERFVDAQPTLATFLCAATVFSSFTIPIAFDQELLTIGWALQVPVFLWIGGRLGVPQLGKIAIGLTVLILIRLLFAIGVEATWASLILNYGISAVVFALTTWFAVKKRETVVSEVMQGATILAGMLWIFLSIRQYFHPGQLWAPEYTFPESGFLTVAILIIALVLNRLGKATGLRIFQQAYFAVLVIAVVQALLAQGLYLNPFWNHIAVGDAPIFNWLFLAYGVPAILFLFVQDDLRKDSHDNLALLFQILAGVFLFVLINLEVRHLFHGSYIDNVTVSIPENYCYSAAWIFIACAVLILGVLRNHIGLRYLSLAIMGLATFKVFLFDSAHLRDLYRVLSFLGLGISLLGLAYLYQKVIFKRVPREGEV